MKWNVSIPLTEWQILKWKIIRSTYVLQSKQVKIELQANTYK